MEDLNPSYLSRFFHEKVGCTFGEYLSFVRLQRSLKILKNPKWTIVDIAFEFGFPSVKAYNHVFKKVFNITPSTWRAEKEKKVNISENMDLENVSPYGSYNKDSAEKLLEPWLKEF